MIEIIPKKESEVLKAEKIFLVLSVLIFILSLSLFGWLFFAEKNEKNNISEIEKTIGEKKNQEVISLEKEVFHFQKKISDFSKVLKEHYFYSLIFPILEKNTHPQVYFSKTDIDFSQAKITFSGKTENFVTLFQQQKILKENPIFKSINLGKISLDKENKVNFEVEILFDKEILK